MTLKKTLDAYRVRLAPELKRLGLIEPGKTLLLAMKTKPEDYFGAPILSNSKLSHPGGLEVKESTLRLGSLTHAAIYEPPVFDASPEYRQYLTAEPGNLAPRTPPTENDKVVRHVVAMRDSALKCPILSMFLRDTGTVYEGEGYGLLWGLVPVKVKLDARLRQSGHDLKTTACNTRQEFLDRFAPYGYWRQAVLYKAVYGLKNFYFTGVAKRAPHPTFLVDTSQYKPEMRAATKELEQLVLDWLVKDPYYIENALAFLEQHVKRARPTKQNGKA